MTDAETGMRGYGASGNKAFLEPYTRALPRISSDLQDLKGMVTDNPVQVKRIDSIDIGCSRAAVF
jgi:CHASE3 domain sensor protein